MAIPNDFTPIPEDDRPKPKATRTIMPLIALLVMAGSVFWIFQRSDTSRPREAPSIPVSTAASMVGSIAMVPNPVDPLSGVIHDPEAVHAASVAQTEYELAVGAAKHETFPRPVILAVEPGGIEYPPLPSVMVEQVGSDPGLAKVEDRVDVMANQIDEIKHLVEKRNLKVQVNPKKKKKPSAP